MAIKPTVDSPGGVRGIAIIIANGSGRSPHQFLFLLVKWLVRRLHGRAEFVLKTEGVAEGPSREPV